MNANLNGMNANENKKAAELNKIITDLIEDVSATTVGVENED